MRRYALLLGLVVLTAAARPQCDRRAAFESCADVDVRLDRGGCVDFALECDPSWEHLGTVALCDTHSGLWLEIERRPESNRVQVCAAPDMPAIADEPIEFIYVDTDNIAWVGMAYVTVGEPLQIGVTATPQVIHQGESSQLEVTATGGTPPYTYRWNYSDAFVGPYDIADPVVKPLTGEVFGVSVHDSGAQHKSASVLVDVVPVVATLATPDTVDAGEMVSLAAGVSPPFPDGTVLGWTWSPDLLSGSPLVPTAASTTATPEVSTTYIYTFRTFYGTVVSDSAHVHVRPAP